MTTAVEERKVIDSAIRTIQKHLDREANNRSLRVLKPLDLCPIQKARLVYDLASELDGQPKKSFFGRIKRALSRFGFRFNRDIPRFS